MKTPLPRLRHLPKSRQTRWGSLHRLQVDSLLKGRSFSTPGRNGTMAYREQLLLNRTAAAVHAVHDVDEVLPTRELDREMKAVPAKWSQ